MTILAATERMNVDWLIEHGPRIGLIIALALGASKLAKSSVRRVRRRLEGSGGGTQAIALQRVTTIATAMSSALRAVIWSIAVLLLLGEIGLDMGPLIAGAGVAGVALAFGAQSLVRDFLSGFFIILENQFGVGQILEVRTTAGDITGKVESLSLRVTALRAFNGTLYVIPNGNLQLIGNQSRGWARAIVDVAVDRDEDLDRARAVLDEVCAEMERDGTPDGWLISRPKVLGVEEMRDDAFVFRVVAETRTSRRLHVERELRRRIKVRFDERDIRSPAGPFGSLIGRPAHSDA